MEAITDAVSQFFTRTVSQVAQREGRVLRSALMRLVYALALVAATLALASLGIALMLFALFVRVEEAFGMASAAVATAATAFALAAAMAYWVRELTSSRASD